MNPQTANYVHHGSALKHEPSQMTGKSDKLPSCSEAGMNKPWEFFALPFLGCQEHVEENLLSSFVNPPNEKQEAIWAKLETLQRKLLSAKELHSKSNALQLEPPLLTFSSARNAKQAAHSSLCVLSLEGFLHHLPHSQNPNQLDCLSNPSLNSHSTRIDWVRKPLNSPASRNWMVKH